MPPVVRQKVYAYITRGDDVLVFRHVDVPEAGVQVPGGTVEPGEALAVAALREAGEETGLADLEVVAALGQTTHVVDDPRRPDEVHERHYFHLRCGAEPPERWLHEERFPAGGGPPFRFAFSWAPVREAPGLLIADMGELCGQLRDDRVETGA